MLLKDYQYYYEVNNKDNFLHFPFPHKNHPEII